MSRTRRSSATVREDMEAALRFMAGEGLDLILTSGGLGPTADDLTAEVVGRAQGRKMVLDEALRGTDRGDPQAARETLAEPRYGRNQREQPQAGGDPTGRDHTGARWHCPGARRARKGAAEQADGGGAAGPAKRAAADVERGGRDGGAENGDQRRDRVPAKDAEVVRDPRVGDRRDIAGGRTRGRRVGQAGDHNVPETRRGRGRDPL